MRKGIDDLKSLILDEPAPFDSTGKYIGTKETEAEYIRRRDAYADRMSEHNDNYIRRLRNTGMYGKEIKLTGTIETPDTPRFKMPTGEQLVATAIIFNEGKVDKDSLVNMVGMCLFVLDRLYENNDIMIPSSKETTDEKING